MTWHGIEIATRATYKSHDQRKKKRLSVHELQNIYSNNFFSYVLNIYIICLKDASCTDQKKWKKVKLPIAKRGQILNWSYLQNISSYNYVHEHFAYFQIFKTVYVCNLFNRVWNKIVKYGRHTAPPTSWSAYRLVRKS